MKPTFIVAAIAVLAKCVRHTCEAQNSAGSLSIPETAASRFDAANYPAPPVHLPGNGLAQHDLLDAGEWDTRKTNATLFLVKGCKVVWTYSISRKDEFSSQESEFSDINRCSNGDTIISNGHPA
jgi:hypothetical protein